MNRERVDRLAGELINYCVTGQDPGEGKGERAQGSRPLTETHPQATASPPGLRGSTLGEGGGWGWGEVGRHPEDGSGLEYVLSKP